MLKFAFPENEKCLLKINIMLITLRGLRSKRVMSNLNRYVGIICLCRQKLLQWIWTFSSYIHNIYNFSSHIIIISLKSSITITAYSNILYKRKNKYSQSCYHSEARRIQASSAFSAINFLPRKYPPIFFLLLPNNKSTTHCLRYISNTLVHTSVETVVTVIFATSTAIN